MGRSEGRFNGQGLRFWPFLTPPRNGPIGRAFQWPGFCVLGHCAQWANRKGVSMARALRFSNADAQWADRRDVSMAKVCVLGHCAQWANRKDVSMASVLRFRA